jgi:beta-galactosidase
VDENDRCYLEGTPHGLMDVLGLRAMEIDGLFEGEVNQLIPIENNHLELTNTYTCSNLCELVQVEHAASIRYNDKHQYLFI